MTIWKFSDGTTVRLGGEVGGNAWFAGWLREALGGRPMVSIWPPPGGEVALDVKDAALLDRWLLNELAWVNRARAAGLTLTERPEGVPALPPPPWAGEKHVPGRVY